MAALTTVVPTNRGNSDLKIGDNLGIQTYEVTPGVGSAVEWIATGFASIRSVLGWAPIGTAPGFIGVKASATVTFDATDPTANDTITVNGVVYTIVATPSVAFDLDLDATEANMASNFAGAINCVIAGGTGSFDNDTKPNPDVSAVAASAIVTLTARLPGVAGNAFTLAESGTGVTLSGATFAGGIDPGVSFVLNADGTGVTAGDDPGHLGIESSDAKLIQVTVLGTLT